MAVDLKLLRIMKHRDDFMKIKNRVPTESIESTTEILLRDFGKYFDKFQDHSKIDFKLFTTLFYVWHPKLSKEQKEAYTNILGRCSQDVPEDEKDIVIHGLLELRLASDLATLLLKFDDGDIGNIHGDLSSIIQTFTIDARVKGLDYIRVDVDEMLAQETSTDGMQWRLECLNRSMRPLRPGDFGIVAGRPDRGKTTFLASEVTNLAKQSNKSIVWLNNEGPGQRIYPRLWQAALGIPMSEIIKLHQAGVLMRDYCEAINADDPYKIRIVDIHGQDTYAVERIVDQQKPSVVVYDMIDNIRSGGQVAARTDLALEGMYQWARELGVKYDFSGIATSQISRDGDDMQFPADHMLKDSKTGKQGACDFILMIGAISDPGYIGARFIGLPKNKLRREGQDGDPRATVRYLPQIARYEDIPMIQDDGDENGDE